MTTRPIAADRRGVSETFAVGALVGITLLMVLSVAIFVLAVDVEDDQVGDAEFGYDYEGSGDTLLVRYVEGPEYPATEVLFATDNNQGTWAELAGMGANGTVGPGDALQLSGRGSWGQPVTGATELEIYHVRNGTRTRLSNWTA